MSVPVITVAQMREWEQATWASGQTEGAVIARVGEQLAKRALETTREGDRIIILAGKGHNGDDARAMLPHLHGRDARLIVVRDPVNGGADFAKQLDRRPALIVDGLIGIGLGGPISHDWLHFIARVNHSHAPIMAVDVPSGLNPDTGVVATCAIQASETLTVGAAKRGLLKMEAAAYVGRLIVLPDVGLLPCPCESDLQWTLPADFDGFPPGRPVSTHKGSFGHLAIVAGSCGYHGAAVLASRGAQRARPGLITLFVQPDVYAPVASQLQAVMASPWSADRSLDRFSGLLFGPGLADANLPKSVREAALTAWQSFSGPVVVDASALEWLPSGSTPENAIRVITPHPGEAARLLKVSTAEVQADRVGTVRRLSQQFGGCWVVLKGHQTTIGTMQGDVFVNGSGCPALAQGGSGDVLSGFIAGWLAQPLLRTDAPLAIRYAVWEHGAAADRLEQRQPNWTIEELATELGRVPALRC